MALRARPIVAIGFYLTLLSYSPAWTEPDDAPDMPAGAGNPSATLRTVEQDIGQSQKRSAALLHQRQQLQQKIAELRDQSIKAARSEQDNEAALSSLQRDLSDLAARSTHSATALSEQRDHQSVFVAALQRVALLPPEALVFSPQPPIDIERSAMLMGAIVPILRDQVQSLAANLNQLSKLKQKTAEKRQEVLTKQAVIHTERARLDRLMLERKALDATARQAADAEQKRLAILSGRATSLRDLLQRIEQEQQERKAQAREAALKRGASEHEEHRVVLHPPPSDAPAIHLLRPTAGDIIKQFGEGDDFSTTKGLSFKTSPGAQIVSPFSGKIMFAGAFKGYGQILIIDHGGGYHSLLAGLDRIHGVVGQSLVAGEPVGTMATSGASRTLYLELRWQGQPIDPTASLEKRD